MGISELKTIKKRSYQLKLPCLHHAIKKVLLFDCTFPMITWVALTHCVSVFTLVLLKEYDSNLVTQHGLYIINYSRGLLCYYIL